MPTEVAPDPGAALVSRARLAWLKLQLLAAEREAESAEADEAAVNRDDELAAVRGRRLQKIEELRRVHEVALAGAVASAEATIAAAEQHAEQIRAEADSIVDARVAVAGVSDGSPNTVVEPVAPDAEASPPSPPPALSNAIELHAQAGSTMDAAQFAEVISRVLEQQNANMLAGLELLLRQQPVAGPVRQRTPMRHAMHLDVFLSGLAALFVLVIILAWVG